MYNFLQPSNKQVICFDFKKQNCVLPIVFNIPCDLASKYNTLKDTIKRIGWSNAILKIKNRMYLRSWSKWVTAGKKHFLKTISYLQNWNKIPWIWVNLVKRAEVAKKCSDSMKKATFFTYVVATKKCQFHSLKPDLDVVLLACTVQSQKSINLRRTKMLHKVEVINWNV